MAEGVEVGRAYVTVLPNATGFATSMQRSIVPAATASGTTAGKKLGGGMLAGFKPMIGPILALFAVNKVVDFFSESISGASDLAESTNKMQVVFKKATPAVMDFASRGAGALGLSQVAARDAAATFGIFGKSAKLQGPALAEFATGATSLATDLASFHNTSPEEAIVAIGAAFRGEMEPIRKYGVLLDDASMRQEAVRLGLIKTTKEALTPQNKVLAAQSLIYKQTTDAQGDFVKTSGGLANQQRIASAQWTDLQAKIGEAFLPAITAAMTFVTGTALPAISGMVDQLMGFGAGFDAAQSGAAPFLAWITGTLLPVLTDIGGQMQAMGVVVLGVLTQLATGMSERLGPMMPAVMEIFGTIGSIITTTLQLAWAYVSGWVKVVVGLWNKWGGLIMDVAAAAWKFVIGIIGPALKVIQNVIALVMNVIKGNWSGAWDNVKGILKGAWDLIKNLVTNSINVVKTVLALGWAVVKGAVVSTWNSVVGKISSAVKSFTGAVSDGVDKVVGWFKSLPGKLVSAVGNVASKLTSIGRDMVEGIWSGISRGYGWIKGKITGWVGDVVGFFKKVFGIGSPSKLMATEVGQWVGKGAVEGVYEALPDAERASDALASALTPSLSPVPLSLGGLSSSLAAGRTSGGTSYGDITVKVALEELAELNDLMDFFDMLDRKVKAGV